MKLTPEQRLRRIAEIIWNVDGRCLAVDGPVTPTLQEMRQSEISEIWKLAKPFIVARKKYKRKEQS